MKVREHVISSIPIGVGFYLLSRSIPATVACVFSTILIDVDHLIDYFLTFGLKLRIKDFFQATRDLRYRKFHLFFHSYELLFLLLFIFAFNRNRILLGFITGLGVHLLFDQCYNPVKSFSYFFIYRLKNSFKKEKIFDLKRVSIL